MFLVMSQKNKLSVFEVSGEVSCGQKPFSFSCLALFCGLWSFACDLKGWLDCCLLFRGLQMLLLVFLSLSHPHSVFWHLTFYCDYQICYWEMMIVQRDWVIFRIRYPWNFSGLGLRSGGGTSVSSAPSSWCSRTSVVCQIKVFSSGNTGWFKWIISPYTITRDGKENEKDHP